MKKISLALSITILCMMPLHAQEMTISPRGKALAVFLDSMRVEDLWLAGRRVHWLTGEPKGKSPSYDKPHPHCSAFVAAVAYRLGIYILRPPGHSETLLANAQVETGSLPKARLKGGGNWGQGSRPRPLPIRVFW